MNALLIFLLLQRKKEKKTALILLYTIYYKGSQLVEAQSFLTLGGYTDVTL